MWLSLSFRGFKTGLAYLAAGALLGCEVPGPDKRLGESSFGPPPEVGNPGFSETSPFIYSPQVPCTRVGQPVVRISQINAACGEVDVPVTVQNFCDIGAISLAIDYHLSSLQFLGYRGVNLDPAEFVINGSAPGSSSSTRQVRIAWSSTMGSHINVGPLITLRFRVLGSSALLFDQPNGNNTELASSLAIPIPSNFYNGGVTYAAAQCH
jgi:hypothetical protein